MTQIIFIGNISKTVVITIVLSLLQSSLRGQENLVPNPGFEKSSHCASEVWGEMSSKGADEWDSFRGSTDYLNECTEWRKWRNFMGPQTAKSGTGFVGLYAFGGELLRDEREIIGAELLSPLIEGKNYKISVSFSMAEGFPGSACNNLGVLFLTKAYTSDTYRSSRCSTCLNYLPDYAHVSSEEIIKDYKSWTLVQGTFIADSAYTHIAIGNFFSDSKTKVEVILPDNAGKASAYYYVDDVSVVEDKKFDADIDIDDVTLNLPNVFSPNNDELNEYFAPLSTVGIEEIRIMVYNRWGKRIFESTQLNIGWDGKTFNGEDAPADIYYWMVEYKTSNHGKLNKGWVALIR